MNLKARAISGLKWIAVSQAGLQGLQWMTTLILARILAPSDYGLMGMALILINFIMIFKGLGTSAAIVQKQKITENLLSSLFYLNFAFGLSSATMVFFGAPIAAKFFHEHRLVSIIQVLSLSFIFASLSIVHQARIEKEIVFDKLAKAELIAALISSAIAIACALSGLGVWSLVYKNLVEVFVTTICVCYLSGWKPKLVLDTTELKTVLSYSLHLTGFNILNYFARNADYIIIGRYLGATDLGYYTLAYRIMFMPIQNIASIIGRVTFPVYSKIQDDLAKFRKTYLTVIGYIALVVAPMMIGLVIVRREFILTLFGHRWQPVALLLAILAPVGLVQSLISPVGGIYQARGRADWMFRLGLFTSTAYVISFFVGIHWGIYGVAVAYAVASFLLGYPNVAIPFHLIELSIFDYLKTISKPLICAILMAVAVYTLKALFHGTMPPPALLCFLVASGVFVYIGLNWLVNRDMFCDFFDTLGINRSTFRC